MSQPDESKDDRIDDLVRQAAAFPTDEARMEAGVRRRLAAQARPAPGLRGWLDRVLPVPGMAPGMAFAILLAVTPLAVARLPLGSGDPALSLLSAIALGDPVAGAGLGLGPDLTGGL